MRAAWLTMYGLVLAGCGTSPEGTYEGTLRHGGHRVEGASVVVRHHAERSSIHDYELRIPACAVVVQQTSSADLHSVPGQQCSCWVGGRRITGAASAYGHIDDDELDATVTVVLATGLEVEGCSYHFVGHRPRA